MTRNLRIKPKIPPFFLAILGIAFMTACTSVQAQDNPTMTVTPRATIEFSGNISAVTDTTIVVNSLIIITTGAEIETDLLVDNRVHVEGILLENGQIQALEIEYDDDDDTSSRMTPEVTRDVGDDDTFIVIEGPVQSINIDIIVIYGFEIEVDDDLALSVLQIGDVIRVEGQYHDYQSDNDDDNNYIHLISVNITFVSVTVVIIDGQVWRDAGTCTGIPDWVSEDDIQMVLIRCQGSGNSNNPTNNSGDRRGSSNDDDDDDGDDDD